MMLGPEISKSVELTKDIGQNNFFISKEETCELKGLETDKIISSILVKISYF